MGEFPKDEGIERLPALLPRTVYLDIDDTVTPEGAAASPIMIESLARLSRHADIVFVTGSEFDDVRVRLLNELTKVCTSHHTVEVYSSNANVHHSYDGLNHVWLMHQEHALTESDVAKIKTGLHTVLDSAQTTSSPSPSPISPTIVEFPHQVILSMVPSTASEPEKERWTLDTRRAYLSEIIRAIDTVLGGQFKVLSTDPFSIAITKQDKSSAVKDDPKKGFMIGNSLREFGNDRPIYTAGVPSCIVRGPEDTLRIIEKLVGAFERAKQKTPDSNGDS